MVVCPQQSNRGHAVGMLYRLGYGLLVHWLAKRTLFRWPIGGRPRRLGRNPVDRRAPHDLIEAIAGELKDRKFLWLAFTPEGLRSHTDHWQRGFYRFAPAAGVPCVAPAN